MGDGAEDLQGEHSLSRLRVDRITARPDMNAASFSRLQITPSKWLTDRSGCSRRGSPNHGYEPATGRPQRQNARQRRAVAEVPRNGPDLSKFNRAYR